MFYYVQTYLTIVLEILCCVIFFETFSKKKNQNKNIFIMIGLTVISFLVVIFLSKIFVVKQILVIVLVATFMKLYTKETLKRALVLSVIYQSLILVADFITIVINTSFWEETNHTNYLTQSLMVILSKAILFLIVLFINKILGKKGLEQLEDTEWIKFLFFPMFSVCVITVMVSKSGFITDSEQATIFWVIAFGLVGMNIAVFYLVQDVAGREQKLRENKIFETEAHNKLLLYEAVAENVEKQRQLSHEYKNQIACIQALNKSGKTRELEEYIQKINGNVLHDLDSIDTNHAIINAILNAKYEEAVKKDIMVICKINDLSKIHMEEQDVALVISNLLNNAIEACEKCEGKKYIKIKFVHEEDNIVLSVKNTYNGQVKYREGEIITTKKEDEQNHGIGIKNVLRVIEKYEGFHVIKHTEDEFYISILIPQGSL